MKIGCRRVQIRTSIVGIGAEMYICGHIAKATGGK